MMFRIQITIFALTLIVELSIAFHQNILIDQQRHNSVKKEKSLFSCAKQVDEHEERYHTYVRFSRAYQRHVVYNCTDLRKQGKSYVQHDCLCDQTIESFEFLDDALEKYPSITIDKLHDVGLEKDELDHELIVAGMGTIPSANVLTIKEKKLDTEKSKSVLYYLGNIAFTGQQSRYPIGSSELEKMRDSFIHQLGKEVSPKRFQSHTKESIQHNYNRLIDLLTRGRERKIFSSGHSDNILMQLTKSGLSCTESEARALISSFPQLCLYDLHELEERIRFLISPMDEKLLESIRVGAKPGRGRKGKGTNDIDYYKMMRTGYGAGLSIKQATLAIQAVPRLLSLYHEDSQKQSMLYFYNEFGVNMHLLDEGRIELGSRIVGCDNSDLYALSYLRSIGITWEQIRLVIDCFPIVLYCDTDPVWDLLDTNSSVKNELNPSHLHFLRKRLQVTNADITAMIKTHPRLASYSANLLLNKINAIQDRLHLSSQETRKIILRMPSVTGMSINSSEEKDSVLDRQINFFLNDLMLSRNDFKVALLKQPSILQYSVESNMRPKIEYFRHNLLLDESSIRKVVRAAPTFLGLSLEANIKPKIDLLTNQCGLSLEEVGGMITTVPQIILLSSKKKIGPCIDFLSTELKFDDLGDVGDLLVSFPRILTHSVDSISVKIEMIADALEEEGSHSDSAKNEAVKIVRGNPSILVTSKNVFVSRLAKYKSSNIMLVDGLKPKSVGRKRIVSAKKIDEGMEGLTIDDARTLIEVTRNSTANSKYSGIRDATDILDVSSSAIDSACGEGIKLKGGQLRYKKRQSAPSQTPKILFGDIEETPMALYDETAKEVNISAFCSGSVYPSDDINSVRGFRKAGGIAIYIPRVAKAGESFEAKFEEAIKMSFGMIYPRNGENLQFGLVKAGFPFLRPSRARCELYACHGALKVILQLLKQAAEVENMQEKTVNAIIYTDSTYALNLLKDSDALLDWGSVPMQEDAVFDIDGPLSLTNPDLLFPLTKTMFRMTNNAVINRRRNKRLCIGKEVNICFRHTSDLAFDKRNMKRSKELYEEAKLAATWQYKKS